MSGAYIFIHEGHIDEYGMDNGLLSWVPYGTNRRAALVYLEDYQLAEVVVSHLQQKAGVSQDDCDGFREFRVIRTANLSKEDIALSIDIENQKRPEWVQTWVNCIRKIVKRIQPFLKNKAKQNTNNPLDSNEDLGTNLALLGIAPQIAQKIMRHSDYKTTLAHYTVLRVADTAQAVNQFPRIGELSTPNFTGKVKRAAPGTARTLQNPAFICADMQSSSLLKKSKTEGNKNSEVVANTTISNNSHQHAPIRMEKRAMGFEPTTFSLGS